MHLIIKIIPVIIFNNTLSNTYNYNNALNKHGRGLVILYIFLNLEI